MGKGLLWNGISNRRNDPTPVVYLPLTISAFWSAAVQNGTGASSRDPDYEVIGPQVFRFEYYYLLKDGTLQDTPWVSPNTTVNGLRDVEAIAVSVAVIDPASRSLISNPSLFDLASDMEDFKTRKGRGPVKTGVIEAQWNGVVATAISTGFTSTGSSVPPAAASGIRIYSRYFGLNQP
jgi:hypothetical protein